MLLGKVHEVFSYGLFAAIACVVTGLTDIPSLISCSLAPSGVPNYFQFYLFWASVGFIPVAVICAFGTKYADNGEGLLFTSDNIVIIMFGHLVEDALGIMGTPFWFLKDVFTHDWDTWKVVDYVFYLLLIAFIVLGVLLAV